MNNVSGKSRAAEDCLKTILELSLVQKPARTSAIAKRLGVSAASVTIMLKRLADQELVEHVPYRGARLTAQGEQHAVRILRRHRVVEVFLLEVLGYTWDEVHEEAERLEHSASEVLIDAMVRVLGNPAQDPHGAPIPELGRPFEEPTFPSLWDLPSGCRAVLRRVSDRDSELLQRLAQLRLLPGVRLEGLERHPDEETMRVRVKGRTLVLGRELSRSVQVEPLPPHDMRGEVNA